MIRALIFDFDGLILDTEGPEFQTWQEVYAAHGGTLRFETWAETIGTIGGFDPYAELERQIGHPIDREAIRHRRRQRFQELIVAEPARPGVVDYLEAARQRGLGLAVASSSPRAWVTGHLERLGLYRYFRCICCAEDVARVKPDPALYQAALAALGVGAAEAIALEDSPHGVTAAKRAGLFCVAVPNPLTSQLSLAHADLQIESLAALPLAQLLARVS